MVYSKYQEDIFDFANEGKSNGVIGSVAGSGKTTTAVKAANILKNSNPNLKIHFSAFNTKIVKELSKKLPDGTSVSTISSLGWNASLDHFGRNNIKLNDNKLWEIVSEAAPPKLYKKHKNKYQFFYIITQVVSLMKSYVAFEKESIKDIALSYGIVLTNEEIDFCIDVMILNIEINNVFDFEDMVFFPAVFEDIEVPQYDWHLIDECQDLSKSQQMLVKKTLQKRDGLFLAFGDRNQAIYGFRGSDAGSFDNLVKTPNTKMLPLSICYRCGKNIVSEAQKIVPQIQPFEENDDGEVGVSSVTENVQKGDWVVCRNIKPLIQLAFDLITQGKKVSIKGKDTAKPLFKILKKVKSNDKKVVVSYLDNELESIEKDLSAAGVRKPKNHPKYINYKENVDIFRFLEQKCEDVKEIFDFLKNLNKEQKGVYLTSIHSSKGLEADRVFFLNVSLIPSKFAVEDWQKEQEQNLKYVGITRAKKHLVYLNMIDKT